MYYYTGIGSRSTPGNILWVMQLLGTSLAWQGFGLRSGGAVGADTCFEAGAQIGNGYYEIFYQRHYECKAAPEGKRPVLYCDYAPLIASQARNIAKRLHPRWEFLNEGVRELMTRNVFQVLGVDLKNPSQMVLCWTPNAKNVGGTSLALNLAREHNITIYNLAKQETLDGWIDWLKKQEKLNKLMNFS